MIPILYTLQGAMLPISPFLKPVFLLPSLRIPYSCPTLPRPNSNLSSSPEEEKEEEEDYKIITATKSEYNNIIILESDTSKVLLLDNTYNVHSILYKDKTWTNSIWDEFTSLPAIIPPGPIAVFGLGGGTIAHQLLHFWTSLYIHGWEVDEILINRVRQFFNLSELETENDSGGILHVHIGDALSPLTIFEGGYAGIIVDLFCDAKILPELEKVETWLEMREKLMPNGRIMVNCGGDVLEVEAGWEVNLTIRAMCGAFGVKLVNWKKMNEEESGNYLAFTGPLPDGDSWSNAVPEKLGAGIALWRACDPF